MRSALLQEIRQALGNAIAPNLTTRSKGYDLYEAYVFALGVNACKNLKLSVIFKNRDGSQSSRFRFRTGPGSLARGTYSHAEIALGIRKPVIEAHVGIKAMGLSKVEHELDFSILLKEEADFCRTRDVLPRHNKIVLAAECKFYSRRGVGIAMGRGFLGLSDDLGQRDTFFVMNRPAARLEQFIDRHNKWGCFSPVAPAFTDEPTRLISSFQTVVKKFRSNS
jgi:hypothetical protein